MRMGRGAAVWQARAMYETISNASLMYADTCADPNPKSLHRVNKPKGVSSNFRLYPNPNNGNFTLEYQLIENETGVLTIYDIAGKLVYSYPLNSAALHVGIDANSLEAGAYFYEVKIGDKRVKADKLIIIK